MAQVGDPLLNLVEDERQDIAMIGRPRGVLFQYWGRRWWMNVILRVVGIQVIIPATLPAAVSTGFAMIDFEVILRVPANGEGAGRMIDCESRASDRRTGASLPSS